MSTSEQAIEQEIQDKGLTAPRITPADIEANREAWLDEWTQIVLR